MVLKRLPEGEQVHLFVIQNTANNITYILAKDAEIARHIALSHNRIRDKLNGICNRLNTTEPPPGLKNSWAAVSRAMNERVQGIVESKGNFAVIRGEVFAPLSEVK